MAAPLSSIAPVPVKAVRLTRIHTRGGAGLLHDGDGSLYVVGGADRAGHHFNDVYRFDTRAGKLFTLSENKDAGGGVPAPAGGLAAVLACVDDSRFILTHGGINFADGSVYGALHAFNLETQEWSLVPVVGDSTQPSPRTGHSLTLVPAHVAIRDAPSATGACRVLLFGGSSPDEGPMNDLYVLDVHASSAAGSVSPLPAEPADAERADVRKTSAGAADAGAHCVLNARWAQLGTRGPAPAARELHAAFVRCPEGAASAQLVVISGRNDDGAALRDMCVLDLTTLEWQMPVKIPHASVSSASGATARGERLFVFGGLSGDSSLAEELLVLDTRPDSSPTAWTWQKLPLTGAPLPAPRFACTGVLGYATPDEKIAFEPDRQLRERTLLWAFGGMTAAADLNELITIALPS